MHLKGNDTDFTIKWSILKNCISYTGGSKRCNLCLEEKVSTLKEKTEYIFAQQDRKLFGPAFLKIDFK